MAANLLAIDNLFLPAAPAARQVNLPIPRKNAHTEQPDRAASLQDTRPPCTDTLDKPASGHETATDNAAPQAAQKPKMQSPGDFSHNLRRNIAANSARRNPQNSKPEGQNAGAPTANQPNIVQLWLAQYHIEHHGKEGCSKKPDPKAGRQLAQSLAQLKSAKLPAAGENKANTASQPAGGATSDTATAHAAATDTVLKPEQTDAGNPNQLSKEPLGSPDGSKSPKAGDQSATQYGRQPAPFGQNTPTRNTQNLVISDKAAEPAGERTSLQATAAAEKNGVSEVPKAPLLDPKAASAQLKPPALSPQPLDNTEEPTHAARQTSHNGPLVFAHSGSADGKHTGKNLSTKAAAQNLNITGLRITAAQAKNGDGAAPNNAFNTESDSPMSGYNLQSQASETSSQAFGPMTKTHNLSEEQNLPHVGRQILESIKTSLAQNQPNQRITIRLNPPELGRVSIEFRQDQDHITGILQVSRLQTRDELQHLLPEIVRTLQDAGINLKRLDLELTNQGQQQHYRDQSLHDGLPHDHNGPSQPHYSQQQTPETTLTDDAAHYDTYAPRLLFTENQVDMLI